LSKFAEKEDDMGVAATVVLSIAIAIALVMHCGATQYTVGDSAGWDTSTNFNSWVQGKSFAVGDTLDFQYSSLHSVLEVSKSDYDNCQTGNALQSFSDGSTKIPLSNPGNMYFICGTLGHCASGMKMAIDVQSAAANGGSPATVLAPPTTPVSASTPAYSNTGTSVDVAVYGAVIVVVGISLFI
jgi:hypothetical protein